MAELLGLLNRRVEELLLPVPARLARYLLARADEQLEPATGGDAPADVPRVIRLPVSKRELAARLGTVPETLSRTFDRFKRAQVIRMSGDHRLIEILSFEQAPPPRPGVTRRAGGRGVLDRPTGCAYWCGHTPSEEYPEHGQVRRARSSRAGRGERAGGADHEGSRRRCVHAVRPARVRRRRRRPRPPKMPTSARPSPAAAIDGPPPVTVAHGADADWHNDAVTVTFTATSEVSTVAATYVQLDGGGAEATTEVVVRAPRDHQNDGEHVLTFWSVDAEGRTETPQTVTVRIDTRPPVVKQVRLRPDVLHRVQPFRVSYTLSDISGGARLAYEVRDQYGYLARRDRGKDVTTGAGHIDIPDRYGDRKPWTPGLYRVTLSFVDGAGNRSTLRPLLVRDYHPCRASVTYKVKGAGKRVALTFDDGGPAWVWSRMLDTLKAYKMHATFFVIGPYVQRRAARGQTRGEGGPRHRLARLVPLAEHHLGLRRGAPRAHRQRGAVVAGRQGLAGRVVPTALRGPQRDHRRRSRLRRVRPRGDVGRRPRRLARLRLRARSPPTRSRTCTPAPSSACTCARAPWPRCPPSCAACAPVATPR